jgi:hypothetical protein
MSDIELEHILANHLARTPQMQVQDLYKLLHQAALGSGHAVKDIESARGWLERELAEMGAGPDDPLFDPISPDRSILRVHLRPYFAAGKDPELLLQAFVRTANKWQGSTEKLKEYAAAAARLANKGQWEIRPEAIEAFFATMEAQAYPAVHHSETYARLYRPAYRVVAREFLEET